MVDRRVVLSAILLLLAGCSGLSIREGTRAPASTPQATPVPTPSRTPTALPSPTPARDPLASTKWFLSSLHGEPTLPGTRVTLEFYDGFMRGSAGCNKYDSKMLNKMSLFCM